MKWIMVWESVEYDGGKDMAIVMDNDMEVILKGNQEQVIRKMLNKRIFCMIKLPGDKTPIITSKYSSSVFVGSINGWRTRALAIRSAGLKTNYENCEYYLCINGRRGSNSENKKNFEKSIQKITNYGSITYPTVDEVVTFLSDKELLIITNYMQYGNMEALKVKDFLEDVLLLWKDSESKFIRRDEYCDIRIYLKRIGDENPDSYNGLYGVDVRDFEIRQKLVNMYKKSRMYNEHYYSAEYEIQAENNQAAYFVTRFHSNTAWEADPVCIVNARISAFVLPGIVTTSEAEKYTNKKKTMKISTGTQYMIDSIHCNSDIFNDIAEFANYVEDYIGFFGID